MPGKGISQIHLLQKTVSNYWIQCDLHQNKVQHPSLQPIYDIIDQDQVKVLVSHVQESVKEKSNSLKLTSITFQELLGDKQSGVKKLEDGDSRNNDAKEITKLSTEELMKLAAEKYIHFSSNRVNGYTMFIHPYGSSAFSSLSLDETREVELAYQLLTAAEKAGHKQYDLANKILARCEWFASNDGSTVERLVFYFVQALRKKIEIETGIIMPKKVKKQVQSNELGSTSTFMACHQEITFCQVLQFTGIQTIIDHVAKANKIHLIDLNIRSGVHWIALMQDLVEKKSHIQLIKITVIGTRERHIIEETGMRLQRFAESLSFPFSFKLIFLSDMKDLKEEDLNIESDEVVAVYLHTALRTMISRPDRLEHQMGVMKKIQPSVFVATEVEANINSTSFVNRFTEALFDCLGTCLTRHQEHRTTVEGFYLAASIQNIVSTEGEERITRDVKVEVWRSFFAGFGMIEVGLSESCLYQVNLVFEQFSCGSSCTIENNAKCLLLGWKGTPLISLSAWKFK